jgi:hypothetical protein
MLRQPAPQSGPRASGDGVRADANYPWIDTGIRPNLAGFEKEVDTPFAAT